MPNINTMSEVGIKNNSLVEPSHYWGHSLGASDLSFGNLTYSHHNLGKSDFRKILRETIIDGKVILIAKPDKYRKIGKTSIIADYLSFVEDSYLIVPRLNLRDLYEKEFKIPKDRIIVADSPYKLRGINHKNFILDEVSYSDYQLICKELLPLGATIRGVVSIYTDFLIL